MNEKIGVIIDFLTPAYEKTLRDTAARCGYDIVFFPSSKAAEGNVDDCTILYGHPSQRVIAGARNLKWYASCWAGVDHFCRDDLPAGRFHGFGEGGRAIFEPQRSEVESGVIDRRHGGSGDAVQYYFFAVHRSVGFSDLTLPAFHRALKVLRAKWGMSRP